MDHFIDELLSLVSAHGFRYMAQPLKRYLQEYNGTLSLRLTRNPDPVDRRILLTKAAERWLLDHDLSQEDVKKIFK